MGRDGEVGRDGEEMWEEMWEERWEGDGGRGGRREVEEMDGGGGRPHYTIDY